MGKINERFTPFLDDLILESFDDLELDEVAIFLFLTLHMFRFDGASKKRKNGAGRFSASFIANGVKRSPTSIREALAGLIDKGYIKQVEKNYRYGNSYQILKNWVYTKQLTSGQQPDRGGASASPRGDDNQLTHGSNLGRGGTIAANGEQVASSRLGVSQLTAGRENSNIYNKSKSIETPSGRLNLNQLVQKKEEEKTLTRENKEEKEQKEPKSTLWPYYASELKRRHGIEAARGAKENTLGKKLESQFGLEKAKAAVDAYLSDTDPFVKDYAYQLGLLFSQRQKYLAKAPVKRTERRIIDSCEDPNSPRSVFNYGKR